MSGWSVFLHRLYFCRFFPFTVIIAILPLIVMQLHIIEDKSQLGFHSLKISFYLFWFWGFH